jgi:outer membrane protein assembly factor BamD (BamD/ComL family)
MRVVAVGIAALLGAAPFQCGQGPDPGLRQEETAGDALWALGQSFADAGDTHAARQTYRFLVERYPSSRYAPAAQEQLEKNK